MGLRGGRVCTRPSLRGAGLSFQGAGESEASTARSHAPIVVSIHASATLSDITSARSRNRSRGERAGLLPRAASWAARSSRARTTARMARTFSSAQRSACASASARRARRCGVRTGGVGPGVAGRIERLHAGRERLANVLAADEAPAGALHRREAGRRLPPLPAVRLRGGEPTRHARVALLPAVLLDIFIKRALADAGEPGDLAHRHRRTLIERARPGGEIGGLPSPRTFLFPGADGVGVGAGWGSFRAEARARSSSTIWP